MTQPGLLVQVHDDYAKWAADQYVSERALIGRLGLMAK